MRRRWRLAARILCALLACALPGRAAGDVDPMAAVDAAISGAEKSLGKGELAGAESLYRSALGRGWLLLGTLDRLAGRLPAARDAFASASSFSADDRDAIQALALIHLQMGESAAAVRLLTPRVRKDPKDTQGRRLLAQALAASGQAAKAIEELEPARAQAAGDPELAFGLAGTYLGMHEVERAAGLFAQIVKDRPLPQTHVLIGRTYRDFGELTRARAELETALKQDPHVRRAHYYLGMVALKEGGRGGLEAALAEFRAELALAPEDPLASLELGIALVESQRPAEALPALELAARSGPEQPRTLSYLGRAQLGADRPKEGAASLRRALELAQQLGANAAALRAIQLQLGQALQKLGQADEARLHFDAAQRLSEQGTDAEREQLARYMAEAGEAEGAAGVVMPVIEASPLAMLLPDARAALERRLTLALARCYLNLGVLQAQAERFARAAELVEQAAALAPDLPQVQSSLGIAYFNAHQPEKAIAPLTRAIAESPENSGLTRMLALACLDTKQYAKAAELLRDDPERTTDPSLQFAYGLALVKSDRAAEAERIFSRLLSQHADSAELRVLLGQAHAQLGDFDSAILALQSALEMKADVADANATLGLIYLKQGKLAEAEAALKAQLASQPKDLASQQNLAIVLEAAQKPEQALPLLRSLVEAKPDLADARYLLGKILLAQDAADQAVVQLEAAARLAPADANVHYQLGRAYQKLGRSELAQQQFEKFRELKDKR